MLLIICDPENYAFHNFERLLISAKLTKDAYSGYRSPLHISPFNRASQLTEISANHLLLSKDVDVFI